MANKIGPLPWQTPIVEPDSGKPSPFFIRLWQESFLRADAVDEIIGGIDSKADKATLINAGTGLSGGGSLAADRTLNLNANINQLTDVQISSPANLQFLQYDSTLSQWKNVTVGAGYTPSAPTQQIPTLNSPWINYGGGFGGARYYKDDFGKVTIEGLIQAAPGNPTSGVVVFKLIAGYRPSDTLMFTTWNGGGAGRWDVQSNGDVVMQSGNTAFTSLSGISFYV
jgi:hypothetical protein